MQSWFCSAVLQLRWRHTHGHMCQSEGGTDPLKQVGGEGCQSEMKVRYKSMSGQLWEAKLRRERTWTPNIWCWNYYPEKMFFRRKHAVVLPSKQFDRNSRRRHVIVRWSAPIDPRRLPEALPLPWKPTGPAILAFSDRNVTNEKSYVIGCRTIYAQLNSARIYADYVHVDTVINLFAMRFYAQLAL